MNAAAGENVPNAARLDAMIEQPMRERVVQVDADAAHERQGRVGHHRGGRGGEQQADELLVRHERPWSSRRSTSVRNSNLPPVSRVPVESATFSCRRLRRHIFKNSRGRIICAAGGVAAVPGGASGAGIGSGYRRLP